MNGVEAGYVRLVIHDDKETPEEFVIGLLRSVFSQPLSDAIELMATIEMRGKAVCGTYPRAVAQALLQASQERIQTSGHRLAVTAEAGEDAEGDRCKLCGKFAGDKIRLVRTATLICDDCTLAVTDNLSDITRTKQFNFASAAVEWHFAGIPRDQLIATSRQFPGHMRPDVQAAVDKLFSASPLRFFGIHERHRYETLTFASLSRFGDVAHAIAPAQYQEVEIGEAEPVKCLDNGLWLCVADDLRYAVLLSAHREHGEEAGVRIEIVAPAGKTGAEFVRRSFSDIEKAVDAAHCYRGKVLSFDAGANYRGRSQGLMVHKLPPVERANVILPEATLKLLDRNVLKLCGRPRRAASARAVYPQRHPVVWTARHRKDVYHSLPCQQPARPYDVDHHGSADRVARSLYEPCPPVAARHGRDRGCRSHRAGSRDDGTL